MRNARRPNVTEGIASSKVFIALILDESYFVDAKCYAQLEYAKALKKPIRVLVKEGTTIPEGYFDGIADIKFATWTDKEDLVRAILAVLQKGDNDEEKK